jgi:hypothetical protein
MSSPRQLVRTFVWWAFPSLMANRAVRWNVQAERRASPETEAVGTVAGGPFAGLRYPQDIADSVTSPQLKRSGAYEKALVPVIAAEFDRKPPVFVDIGAAEGFYAVSGARLGIQTIAYESSSLQRKALRRLAEANGADLDIHRHCRRVPTLPDDALLLMDVEGAETHLLGGDTPGRLAGTTVIVELHEMFAPGVTDLLRTNFADTHEIEAIKGAAEPGRQGGNPEWAVFRPRAPSTASRDADRRS